ncbi:MAG: demethoxyubiquinone hydroxylase family protein [Rickettsiales bacterium]|nr:demethoxyubiquinone hydroxylase family protein [Rickettsiales bacterium]
MSKAKIEEAIRVNHAGEYGAQQIYKGQLAVLGNDECAPMLKHMAEQEQAHLQTFESYMKERKVRPTALLPFWHVAGYALGAGTALMGKKAAMACTVAVETVIAEHYQEQIDELSDDESELKETITTFREEELEHHDIGIEHEAESAPFYELLSSAIKAGCRVAIEVAKKV